MDKLHLLSIGINIPAVRTYHVVRRGGHVVAFTLIPTYHASYHPCSLALSPALSSLLSCYLSPTRIPPAVTIRLGDFNIIFISRFIFWSPGPVIESSTKSSARMTLSRFEKKKKVYCIKLGSRVSTPCHEPVIRETKQKIYSDK